MEKKLLHDPLPVEVFLSKTPEQVEEVPAPLWTAARRGRILYEQHRNPHSQAGIPSDQPDLHPQATTDIAGTMNAILADVFALYLNTKNFHWHMSGPHLACSPPGCENLR
ncbi:MAG: hypothetical protein WBL40_16100 [Terrimicrobiaceae bacterium]